MLRSEGRCTAPGREAAHARLLLACCLSHWHEGNTEIHSPPPQMLLSVSESWARGPCSSLGRAPHSPAGGFGIEVSDKQVQFPACPRSRPQPLFLRTAGQADPQNLLTHTKRRGDGLPDSASSSHTARGHGSMMERSF